MDFVFLFGKWIDYVDDFKGVFKFLSFKILEFLKFFKYKEFSMVSRKDIEDRLN